MIIHGYTGYKKFTNNIYKKGEVTHELIKYVYKILLRHENTK